MRLAAAIDLLEINEPAGALVVGEGNLCANRQRLVLVSGPDSTASRALPPIEGCVEQSD